MVKSGVGSADTGQALIAATAELKGPMGPVTWPVHKEWLGLPASQDECIRQHRDSTKAVLKGITAASALRPNLKAPIGPGHAVGVHGVARRVGES